MSLQAKMNQIQVPDRKSGHNQNVPEDFWPWKANISPSALYSCSLPLRKKTGRKTPETKWKNMKRWTEQLSTGEFLPEGVYISEKRQELFIPTPEPKFERISHILVLLPFGNVVTVPGQTEAWLLEDSGNGKCNLQELVEQDAESPIPGYFAACLKYRDDNPDQIGIHLKRMKKTSIRPDSE